MSEKLHVFLCSDRYAGSLREGLLGQLVAGLSQREGIALMLLPHLYDLPPDGEAMGRLRAIEGDLVVACWLHPRAAFWVLDANEVRGRLGKGPFSEGEDGATEERQSSDASDLGNRTIWCYDLRRFEDARPLIGEIERVLARGGEGPSASPAEERGLLELGEATRRRWYPVVDRDRCANCLDCLNFCLFGVFGVDREGRLFVESPDACKDGCPACSRVCPEGAIMFPDHQDAAVAGEAASPAGQAGLGLLPLFNAPGPMDQAAAERASFLGEGGAASSPPTPQDASHDELDDLVDGLDAEEF